MKKFHQIRILIQFSGILIICEQLSRPKDLFYPRLPKPRKYTHHLYSKSFFFKFIFFYRKTKLLVVLIRFPKYIFLINIKMHINNKTGKFLAILVFQVINGVPSFKLSYR
jgi:hypothetical protein